MVKRKKVFLSVWLVLVLLATTVSSVWAEETEGEPPSMNLALHKPYTVTSTIIDSVFHRLQTDSFPDDGTKLTDGVVGPNSWTTHGPWVSYLRQDDHQFTVDLEDMHTIHELHAWFLQDKASGIYFPREVTFEVSRNGRAWMNVGEVQTAIPNSRAGIMTQDYTIDGLNVAARYVRMTFHADVHVFISELQVIGKQGIQPGARTPRPTPPERPRQLNYPLAGSKEAGGKKAEVLIYSGYTTTPGLPEWEADDLIPYAAYVDEHGEIVDLMFDSFLFLPFGTAPSGANYGEDATKADWLYFADQLFTDHYRLDALDQAMTQVDAALSKKVKKAKVVLAIPYPGINSDWGDGINLNPADIGEEQALANRTAAVEWYVDYLLDKWDQAGYTNLELNGFYWFREGIGYGVSEYDEELVKNTADIVHAAGPYKFDWIPAGQNPGFHKWKELGFDTALMQPNYAFAAGLPQDRLENNAYLARKYGLGVEMEMHWNVVRDDSLGETYRNNYYDYLDAAHEFHYQNSFLAWYQNTDTLLVSAKSNIPEVRDIYDQTYHFIKGTYKPKK